LSIVAQLELQGYADLWEEFITIYVFIFIDEDLVDLERELQVFDNNLLRFFLELQEF
jgi:hypothetical protein